MRQLVVMGKGGRRNNFIRKFNNQWVPSTEGELTLANQTLVTAVDIVAKSYGAGEGAVKKLLDRAEGFRNESTHAAETLTEATLRDKPIPEFIRKNPLVINVISDYLFAKNALDVNSWGQRKDSPTKRNKRAEERLLKLRAEVELFDDKALVSAWTSALNSHNARRRYWTNQLDEVKAERDIAQAAVSGK